MIVLVYLMYKRDYLTVVFSYRLLERPGVGIRQLNRPPGGPSSDVSSAMLHPCSRDELRSHRGDWESPTAGT